MPGTDTDVVDDTTATDADTTADADATGDADTTTATDTGTAEGDEAWRKDRLKLVQKHATERDKRRALETELVALKAGKTADATETPDAEAIQREADAKAQSKANERILRSEVKAAAAGKLADPADAYKFLDLTQFEVDADGNVDEDEVAEAIDDLIKSKPYLAAAQGGSRHRGTADGGTRKETRPSQLTQADIGRMSPEAIEDARVKGQLDDLMSGKNS